MEIILRYVCLFILSENAAINYRDIQWKDSIVVFLKSYANLVSHKHSKPTSIFTSVMDSHNLYGT